RHPTGMASPWSGGRSRAGTGVRPRPAAARRAFHVARPVHGHDLLDRRAGPVPADAAAAHGRETGMSGVATLHPAWWQDAWRAALHWRPRSTVEALAMLASLYFALTANAAFWHAAITHGWQQWRLAGALLVLLFGLHGLLLGLLLVRGWARPLLAAL